MDKKVLLKTGITIFIICIMGFSDWVFADDSSLEGITWLINYVITFLSWGRVLLAKLAGTFLTNKWVFGEAIGLDILLRKYWNIMKNLANFGLGFYFVFIIFKGLIDNGKGNITKNIKNIILWILVAGIGIQASRFFTAVVVDVSTITLAAASSFPSQIMADNPDTDEAMRKSLSNYLDPSWNRVTKGQTIEFLPQNNAASSYLKTLNVELEQPQTFESLVDSVMPNANDVSGPLYFMGYSILKTNFITSIDSSSEKGFKATILNTIIQGGTTIVYAVEMLVLCVLALMRIMYLRMFIILSPFAILIRCIEKSGQKISGSGGKGFLESFTKQINPKAFFINVFKPTIIVLGLGLAVVFSSLMKKVIVDNETRDFSMGGVTVSSIKDASSNNMGNEGDQTYTTTVDTGIMSFTLGHVGKTFLEIILSIITVLVVYLIIQMAVKMGKGNDFISEKVGKMQDMIGGAITSLPVVPVAGFDEQGEAKTHWVSAGTTFGVDLKGGLRSTGTGIVNSQYNRLNKIKRERENARSDETDAILKSWWPDSDNYLGERDKTELVHAGEGKSGVKQLEEKKRVIDELKTESGLGMFLDPSLARDKTWINTFTAWLNGLAVEPDGKWNGIKGVWDGLGEDKTLEALFTSDNGKKYVSVYANFFGLGEDVTTWNELKKIDISKK